MATAKLFQNGRSQAVRLPKEFRLQGKEVKISKQGNKIDSFFCIPFYSQKRRGRSARV